MLILAVGLNHKTAPIDVREQLAFTAAELPSALGCLRDELGAAVLLSTCNRTELYTTAQHHWAFDVERIVSLLAECRGLTKWLDLARFYVLRQDEAVKHLHRVAAGIDSMVIGEAQILGQVREALAIAQRAGAANPFLTRLFRSALRSGKRARSETRIGHQSVSISSAAVALAKRTLKGLRERTVLVVSAGESGKLAAKSLADSGVANILVTNRTFSKARDLAAQLGGEAMPFSKLADAVASADIVISATGAGSYVLGIDDVQAAKASRNGRLLLLIDIAVPRDIDPRVRELAGVRLYDIDDLQQVADANLRLRAEEAHKVEAIIEEEVARFDAWWHSLEVVPTIVALREHAELNRRAELERTLRRLSHLSADDQRRIEAMTAAIVKKILHRPISHLKANSNGHDYTEAIRALFDLDET